MSASESESGRNRKSWDIAALALRENRVDLIRRFNRVAGAPSPAVLRLQEEFIAGKLEPKEFVDFAKVCLGLIAAAERSGM
jgi:hypothetical protein